MARHRVTVLAVLAVVGLAVLAVVGLAFGGVLGWLGGRPSSTPAAAGAPPRVAVEPAPAAVEVPALSVLREWDTRRAAAHADGAVGRLRDLYQPGSTAGAADVRLLRSYLDRGYRVTGMRTQVLSFTVLDGDPDHWRVRVTDRVVGAVAARSGRIFALPRDTASTRVVTLRRAADGRWRVGDVRDDRRLR